MTPAGSPGLWVAVLGPDGAGKSTVIEGMTGALAPSFRSTRRYHFRPHFGRDTDRGPVTRPHEQRPRGALASLARLAWWGLDCWIGYALLIRPSVRRGELVTFDRYLWDVLVDPRRYRFTATGVARRTARWIPAPDLTVVLDAPVDVLRARKREVGREEAERQRIAYRGLAGRLPRAALVDASRPAEEVVRDVAGRVCAARGLEAGQAAS